MKDGILSYAAPSSFRGMYILQESKIKVLGGHTGA